MPFGGYYYALSEKKVTGCRNNCPSSLYITHITAILWENILEYGVKN